MSDDVDMQEETGVQTAGVPIGGVGAGCIELGRDARFRNITINNNRTADERIPVSPGAFLAIRAKCRGKVNVRILQDGTGLPFREAGIIPTYTSTEELRWRGLYPCAHYRLDSRQFPLEVSWSVMAPIIPYDHQASTLPVMFVGLYIKNNSDAPFEASAVFNWENLCGCTASNRPERRGPMRPVVIKEETEYELDIEGAEGTEQLRPELAGIEYGFRDECRTNAEGNYCLVAKRQQDVETTIMGWDERDPRELEVFWQDFYYEGRLKNRLSRSEKSHSGAVCSSFDLPPERGRSIVFIFTWY